MYEPRYRQARPRVTIRRTMVQKKPTSEFLWLEHGEAQVEEHHDGHTEKEALSERHTRSRAQMRPSITRVKPTMPSAARKSAMRPWWGGRRQPVINGTNDCVNKSKERR